MNKTSLTNEAETRAELRQGELTIPRLHVHFEAAGGSKAAMIGVPVVHNKAIRNLVAFYFIAMIIFAFMHSVLSVIFVIDAIISNTGYELPAYIPIGIDMPPEHDPCSYSIAAPGCEYDLAMTALTSQLVTREPYTVGKR